MTWMKGFPIEFDDKTYWNDASIKKVFAQVRNSCGFKVESKKIFLNR